MYSEADCRFVYTPKWFSKEILKSRVVVNAISSQPGPKDRTF